MKQELLKDVLNGVNVQELRATVGAIGDTPEIAKFNFRASNHWVGGGHNETTIDDYDGACEGHNRSVPFRCVADAPAVLLGKDLGPSPLEYVLAGLASCLTASLVYHAADRGIEIRSIESSLDGDVDLHGFLGLSDDVRNGYESIRVVFKIDADASEETLRELCELAQQRSPVFDVVSNPVPVSVGLDTRN